MTFTKEPPMRRWLLPILALLVLLVLAACSNKPPEPYQGGNVSELSIHDIKTGTGPEAEPGMEVLVQYTGWLYDEHAEDNRGQEFDSTAKRDDTPFRFVLGAGKVIKGWDKGVVGMRVGGVRELLIPPDLAYGDRGAGGGIIPPGASLVFKVELVDAQKP